jgi:hypothetical protein
MMTQSFFVQAHWDEEARVWFSSTDIPGLVIEADSLPEFEQYVRELAPEMLSANLGLSGPLPPVTLVVEERRRLDLVA